MTKLQKYPQKGRFATKISDSLRNRLWPVDFKAVIKEGINKLASDLIELSHSIHDEPELAYEERKSSARLVRSLKAAGIEVEYPAFGLETAFRSVVGEGPEVVICAEYDALPEIGHACGHNIIAASSVGAGIALSEVAGDLGVQVTVLGTPAEESGGGKVDLLNAGAFDNAAAAMMVHPGPMEVVDLPTLAWSTVEVEFHGKEAHASAFPHLGHNALDAMTISYTAIGALRQHIQSTERVHGIVLHGGDAPNVVPKFTKARYFVRAINLDDLEPLKERVVKCFEAGALASGCEMKLHWLGNDYDYVRSDPFLVGLYDANLRELGRTALPRSQVERFAASTDMGNVSAVVPSIHPMMSIDSLPAVNHQADFTAATVTSAGDKAVVDAALAMAWTVADLATHEDGVSKLTKPGS
jgi:amidohydrolase